MVSFFTLKSSRARMVALSVVDIIMIVACSYLALFLRVMDDARELRLYLPGIHNAFLTLSFEVYLSRAKGKNRPFVSLPKKCYTVSE